MVSNASFFTANAAFATSFSASGVRADAAFAFAFASVHLVEAGTMAGGKFCRCQPDSAWKVKGQANGKATVDLGKYELLLDEHSSRIQIVNKANGEVTNIWGDPHIDWNKDGKNDADFWSKTTFELEDGTKITIDTVPYKGNPNMYLADTVTVTKGEQAIQITGLGQNELGDLHIDQSTRGGNALDWAVTDGYVVRENPNGAGWLDANTGKLATQRDFDITKPGAHKPYEFIQQFSQQFGLALGLYLSTGSLLALASWDGGADRSEGAHRHCPHRHRFEAV